MKQRVSLSLQFIDSVSHPVRAPVLSLSLTEGAGGIRTHYQSKVKPLTSTPTAIKKHSHRPRFPSWTACLVFGIRFFLESHDKPPFDISLPIRLGLERYVRYLVTRVGVWPGHPSSVTAPSVTIQ